MVKQKETKPSQVVIFVEGDTDEILLEGICRYLNLVTIPKSLKGNNGNAKLTDLYGHAKKVYQKGYQTKELVDALRMGIIRKKHADDLSELEKALNVKIQ